MRRSSGGYELALSPLVLALVAFVVDRWLGTTPILTIMAAVIGLAGAVVKLYYGYTREMDQHDADAPWSRRDG
jgi:F0F1-type ATP synthase assembly protein I